MSDSYQTACNQDGDAANRITKFNGQDLKVLVSAGLCWLKANHKFVNSLNVFPVPDGDTGTNMVLTMQAAENEISKMDDTNAGKIARAIAQGALMGARGNSGVILSQLWRGFARGLDNLEDIDAQVLIHALDEARVTAYKGVVRPVEGTILTVAKDISIEALKTTLEDEDLYSILKRIVESAGESVERTPELLPILKQAGVVDAGGKGLFYILEGMLRQLENQPLDISQTLVKPLSSLNLDDNNEIEPGQDYEVVIDFSPDKKLEIDEFYAQLSDIGTSIQLGEGEKLYRLHIHVATEKRYLPIDYVMRLGTISAVHIENLIAQMEKNQEDRAPKIKFQSVTPGEIAVVAISPGFGISQIFASLSVAALVNGGQTMNPSTEEILKAFEDLPTDRIIILPNNKNIILAAQTAMTMTVKKVAVIPSKSIPQGLNAMLRWTPEGDFDEVVERMTQAIHEVESGEITFANRNLEYNGVKVKEGEIIAILNGDLIYSSDTLLGACMGLLERANAGQKERITLFSGDNIKQADIDEVVNEIHEKYKSQEIELHEGGQPHYHFIIAIE
jgi:uncharacterized protein